MARKKQTLVIIAAVLATIGIGTDVSVASAQTTAAVSSSAPVVASRLTVASPQTQAAAAVVAAINRSRAALHIPVLWWGVRITNSAYLHSLKMDQFNTMSHQLPGEAPLGTRISAQGVAWTWVGENVGEAYSSSSTASALTAAALSLETLMMTEVYPGHRENILSRNVFLVGVDVVFDPVSHRVWLTEDFAN